MRHADGEGGRAAGAVEQRLLANRVRESLHFGGGYGESPTGNGGARGGRGLSDDTRGTINCEVNAGLEDAGGNDRHDRDGGLGHHGAVAHHASFRFAGDQLGCGSAGDQGMKAADGAAGDSDKGKGEDFSREHRAGAIDKTG